MAEHLQLPPSSHIHKRKSSDNLSREVAKKQKDATETEVRRRSHWVPKPIRQRSKYYCYYCSEEQALTQGHCRVCEHETLKCSECLAGRTSKSVSAQESGNSKHQPLPILHEEKLQKPDATEFNPKKDLIFSPPQNSWTLADMELQDGDSITSFALSGDFPLFSVDTITKMQRELLNDTVPKKFGKSSDIVDCQLRGMMPEYAMFTYNAWNHPATLAAISQVVGIDLIPVMDMEISHVNILSSSDIDNRPIQWHRDDYPYVCVLMLGDTTQISGGEICFRTGSGGILVSDPPKMGSAYILHGRRIEHSVRSFKGCTKRITAVTSFRPRSPFVQDQTKLYNVRAVSDLDQLYFQFVQYRWRIAIQRLAGLEQILNGREVIGWTPQRLSLGKNLEEIQHFVSETSTQVDLPTLHGPVSASSKVNAINLTIACPEQVLHLYSTGLQIARDSLRSGLHEQKVAGTFDRDLAQSTFSLVDNILRQLMEE